MRTFFKILIIIMALAVVHSLERQKDSSEDSSVISSFISDGGESRRRKGHYFLYPYYGWHALTWIYWIKVKLVVVAFFAYTAFIWALRYMGSYNDKCSNGGHHVYYSQGHYRSFSTLQTPKSLQTLIT